jgi:GTP cyclohydrolase I
MRNQNSRQLKENSGGTEDHRDFNLNLWDLDGSSFFFDKKSNDFESTGTFNNTGLNYNNNFNIIKTTKNDNKEMINYVINQVTKKYKNKSINSSFVKNNNNNPSEKKYFTKIMKQKTNLNNHKKNIYKMKNNSFCHNSHGSHNISKDFNNKKSNISIENNKKRKPKPRLNHSVDYSRVKDIDKRILLNNKGDNNYYSKKHHLNKSLSIENMNHKYNSDATKQYKSKKNNNNNTPIINNKKRLKKSNSIDNNISIKKKYKK